jgi:YidC/Oxa1 family membrane protein insertase
MKMDRNQVIGFLLMGVLLLAWFYVTTKDAQQLRLEQQRYADSVAREKRLADSIANLQDTTSLQRISDSAAAPAPATEQLTVVENEVLKITFTNKGGQPKQVELKKYASLHKDMPVVLGGTDFDKISYRVNTADMRAKEVVDLYFNEPQISREADGSQRITFQTSAPGTGIIRHHFLVRPDDYMIDWTLELEGADRLLTQGALNLVWQAQPMQQETDVVYERTQSTICFYEPEDGDFDYIQTKAQKKFEQPVQWVSVAQQFFNTTLVAKNNFSSGEVTMNKGVDTSAKIAEVTAALQARLPLGNNASFPMQLYYGPNDYKVLRKQATDMDKIVNLGRDFYAFVRPINRYIVMPLFDLFNSFIVSFGLVIAFLTLAIRLITSPLIYKSYLSGAKMKALRPEIEKLREKYGNDQQQIGVEQMKLFREAGVNPLGGCIPALLQIPIFFALYSFFNSNISLRGESFLWADNLASYDVILRFPFHVWLLGDHLSLFTLTAVLTSFLISVYNMNMTPDSGNPALKYMPYIFPFILLFVFNSLPAALTWYYTVSNIITLILQFVIQNYIIDHDKILARIEENRKKPKAKSKWQERLEQMQEAQRKAQAMREKNQKGR